MCGFARRIRAAKIPKLERIRMEYGLPEFPDGQFWPGTQMTGLIVGEEGGGARMIDATWWFILEDKGGQLKPNRSITCFNARNLDGRLWKGPFKTSRCILPATSIVETKDKHSYHMEAEEGLLLGGLYRTWKHGEELLHSCAIITCPPHERFSEYHDKSIPLFLPDDPKLIAAWLDPGFHDSDFFKGMIEAPRLPIDLNVTPVKNSQHLEPLGDAGVLERD